VGSSAKYTAIVRVIVPAAGLGKRFAPAGLDGPKELLPLGGTPVLGHALHEAARAGFDEACIVLSPAKLEAVSAYLDKSDVAIRIHIEIQPHPLGIGDAVLRGWAGLPVGVLLPDDVVLTDQHWVDLLAAHKTHRAPVLCVRPVAYESIGRFGIAECTGDRLTRVIEKPGRGDTGSNLAIFGRYIVTESVIRTLEQGTKGPAGELELTSGFAGAIKRPPGAFVVRFTGRIYDCGTPADYERARADFPADWRKSSGLRSRDSDPSADRRPAR